MIIYISGPITGYADRNKKAFSLAEKEIKSIFNSIKIDEKIKIINPVKLGLKLDNKILANRGGLPTWEEYMRACIKALSDVDFVYLLPNWGDSQGAVLEKYLAERLKIPCAENIKELSKLVLNRGII